jgi:endoribonuclease LACTB2
MELQTNIQLIAKGVTCLELPAHTLPPFTHINTYVVVSNGEAVVIDPGFYEERALELVNNTVRGQTLKAVILTHTHPDHVEGIDLVRQHYADIPIYVHANELGRVKDYSTTEALDMTQPFLVGDLELLPVFTPGHSPGHVSFYLPDLKLALVGDMVAGFGSIWIGTPEGNIRDYLMSLEALINLELESLAPGHGDIITEPYKKLAEVKTHRLQRLEQVCKALDDGPRTLEELRQIIYPEADVRMTTLAEQSLLALLEKLEQDNLVQQQDKIFKSVNKF